MPFAVIRPTKEDISSEEVFETLSKEFLTEEYRNKNKLREYAFNYINKAMKEAFEFRREVKEIADSYKKGNIPQVLIEFCLDQSDLESFVEINSGIASPLRWNPYSNVSEDDWKGNKEIKKAHLYRTLKGEEPLLGDFAGIIVPQFHGHIVNTILMSISNYLLEEGEDKINELVDTKYPQFIEGKALARYPSEKGLLPFQEVPSEKQSQLYMDLTGAKFTKKVPFSEMAKSYCKSRLIMTSLGDERTKPLIYKAA